MAAVWKWYGRALEGQFGPTPARRVDWAGDTIKVAFTAAGHTPDQDAHDFRADLTNEVTGVLFPAGGVPVTGRSVAYDAATNELRLIHADIVVGPLATALGLRNAHLYKDTGNAATDPLIGYLVFDGDQTVSNGTFTVDVDSTGTLKITPAA